MTLILIYSWDQCLLFCLSKLYDSINKKEKAKTESNEQGWMQ